MQGPGPVKSTHTPGGLDSSSVISRVDLRQIFELSVPQLLPLESGDSSNT